MSPVDTTPFPIWPRDFVSDLKSAPETLSSWDNCMAKSYCKWPVIVAIIVGALIVISILACIINCLCCGIQCCKCCGCCSCCCPSPRRKKEPKYLDDPYNQPPPMPTNNPYQPPAPPSLPTYRGAQVARFDTPPSPAVSKGNEDALPAMPTWDSAVTKRVEEPGHHQDAMEMEPLNLANQRPRRMPSAPRANGAGYMGPPPIRTDTAFSSSGFHPDDQGAYHARSPGGPSPGPISPYEQPYGDYSQNYGSQPNYLPIGTAVSPVTDASPSPYRHPSPAINQTPGMALSTDGARPIPYRQPSPAIHQSPINRTMSPANAAPPYRALTPANANPAYRAMSPPTQEPVYRAMSPPSHEPVYRTMSPPSQEAAYRAIPPPGHEPAYQAMPPPGPEPTYRAMPHPLNTEPVYRDTSPSIPSSPPPPFTSSPAPHETIQDSGRPPTLLQSGRKAVPNSFRDV
ncbi:hypothetical protein ANOM_008556 [Aspergillus nomiae NRRL 13137]|uniref:Uncharacterized protein n=1 Tax=Aspergillus nomiae NRRL (strain ATCC 15546 / NRRL 13137 / CBS 260.88 / M93) TaxID=1509407 RepID=A0A0L1IVJ5_ASPN3|nr:uncharacterized protein ANOM_008556 [Aspergillus nomiae NRRL 13137]KNG83509.1 hypothetical protein ANOM_008556 [Aspergillus nomiae NRRL 13137]